MHLWELNNYVIGYKQLIRREQENIVSQAYQTAAFTNSKKKPKPLKYYLEKIKSAFSGNKGKYEVDTEKAKQIEDTIERLLKEKEVNSNG